MNPQKRSLGRDAIDYLIYDIIAARQTDRQKELNDVYYILSSGLQNLFHLNLRKRKFYHNFQTL